MAQQVESAPTAAEEVIADDSAVSDSPAGSAPTDAPAAKPASLQTDATADADASAAQIDEDPNASSAPDAPSAAAEEPAAAAEPTDNGSAAAAAAGPAAADDAPVTADDAPAAVSTKQEPVEEKQEEPEQEEQQQQQEAQDAKPEAEESKDEEQQQQPSASASEQPPAEAAAGAAAVEEASKAEASAAPAAEAAAVVKAKGDAGDSSPFVPADAKLQTPPKEAQANGDGAHASDAASPAASASTPAAEVSVEPGRVQELTSRLSANAPPKRLSTSGSGGPAIVPPVLARSVSSSGLRSGEASPASTSAHDSKNTINVSLLLKAGALKKVPLKDFVPYEELQRLRVEDGIDATRKEDYLSEDEFAKVFGMPRDTFKAQPAWRQAQAKKKTNLF